MRYSIAIFLNYYNYNIFFTLEVNCICLSIASNLRHKHTEEKSREIIILYIFGVATNQTIICRKSLYKCILSEILKRHKHLVYIPFKRSFSVVPLNEIILQSFFKILVSPTAEKYLSH